MKPNKKFQELRKLKGPSQLEFAGKLGVSRSLIADIERGKANLSKKIMSKITQVFDIQPGYFLTDVNKNLPNFIQGIDTGFTQEDIVQMRKNAKDRINKLRASKLVDAETLSDGEILMIYGDKNSTIALKNISEERQQKLNKLREKQKVIAEKAIGTFAEESATYREFKNSILAIQSFENLLNNIIYCSEINELIKVDESAWAYANLPFSSFIEFLKADFERIEPYSHIFLSLANAMKSFAEQAFNIPNEIIGIDGAEFTEYLAMNGKSGIKTQ